MKMAILAIGLFLSATVLAQLPGGVSGQLTMWLRADAANTIEVSPNATFVNRWQYFNDSDPAKAFTQSPPFMRNGGTQGGILSNDPRPALVANGLNFQNTVRFSGSQKMDGPIGSLAPISEGDDSYSIFLVWNSHKTSLEGERIWSQWDCDAWGGIQRTGASFVTGSDGMTWSYGGQFEFWPYGQGIKRTFSPANWYVSNLNLLPQDVDDLEIADQHNSSSPMILSTDPDGEFTGGIPDGDGARNISTISHNLGTCMDGRSRFEGDLAEMIVYDRTLTALERQKIFSYLALKYGITLTGSHYVASDWNGISGTQFWEAGLGYDHDIFGVARDDAAGGSGLNITASNSVNTGSGNGTGQAGKGNIVIRVDPGNLQQLQALVIGNDGASLSSVTADLPAAIATSRRMSREWKVQMNGRVGPVDLSFDINGLLIVGDPADVNNFAILIDEDGNGDFTNGSYTLRMPSSIADGLLHFNALTMPDDAVFTFVTTLQFNTPLQVDWQTFTINKAASHNQLSWLVWEDATVSHYAIEHNLNNAGFYKIGEVTATGGASSQLLSYAYDHSSPYSGWHAYRIGRVLQSGVHEYSKVLTVWRDDVAEVALQPNPFHSTLSIQFKLESPQDVHVTLRGPNGSVLHSKQVRGKKGMNQLSFDALGGLASGLYMVEITGKVFRWVKKIVK